MRTFHPCEAGKDGDNLRGNFLSGIFNLTYHSNQIRGQNEKEIQDRIDWEKKKYISGCLCLLSHVTTSNRSIILTFLFFSPLSFISSSFVFLSPFPCFIFSFLTSTYLLVFHLSFSFLFFSFLHSLSLSSHSLLPSFLVLMFLISF